MSSGLHRLSFDLQILPWASGLKNSPIWVTPLSSYHNLPCCMSWGKCDKSRKNHNGDEDELMNTCTASTMRGNTLKAFTAYRVRRYFGYVQKQSFSETARGSIARLCSNDGHFIGQQHTKFYFIAVSLAFSRSKNLTRGMTVPDRRSLLGKRVETDTKRIFSWSNFLTVGSGWLALLRHAHGTRAVSKSIWVEVGAALWGLGIGGVGTSIVTYVI